MPYGGQARLVCCRKTGSQRNVVGSIDPARVRGERICRRRVEEVAPKLALQGRYRRSQQILALVCQFVRVVGIQAHTRGPDTEFALVRWRRRDRRPVPTQGLDFGCAHPLDAVQNTNNEISQPLRHFFERHARLSVAHKAKVRVCGICLVREPAYDHAISIAEQHQVRQYATLADGPQTVALHPRPVIDIDHQIVRSPRAMEPIRFVLEAPPVLDHPRAQRQRGTVYPVPQALGAVVDGSGNHLPVHVHGQAAPRAREYRVAYARRILPLDAKLDHAAPPQSKRPFGSRGYSDSRSL